jgi:hypothetical protein
MGVWGQAPSINLAYYKEFGITAKMLNNAKIQVGALQWKKEDWKHLVMP